MKYALLVVCLPALAFADEKVGWGVGSGGKVYGGAREACEAFLRETQSGGVTYVVERMESTEKGDQYCWFKNAKDEGKAVTQTLIYRVRRRDFEGVPMFRPGFAAKKKEPNQTLGHDLGPGYYFYKEQWVARGYAIAMFLEAYTDRGNTPVEKVPDALVYEYDWKAPEKVFDFSQGKLLAEFEDLACDMLTPDLAERMFDGEVNPVSYYKVFVEFLKKKSKKPGDLAVVIGPDYRYSIAGNGQEDPDLICGMKKEDRLTRRQPQMRMTKQAFDETDKGAMISLEARFPTKDDVASALVGHQTSSLFKSCTPTAKTGSCAVSTPPVGKLVFHRRKWQSVIYLHKADPKANANHYHLRIGDVIIDRTFMQFDDAAADNESKAELFVGTKADLIVRLDNMTKPDMSPGTKLYEAYWGNSSPKIETIQPRLVWKSSGLSEWNGTVPSFDGYRSDPTDMK